MNSITRLLRRTFLDSWREADAQADTAGTDDFDWRPIVVLVTTAVTLTIDCVGFMLLVGPIDADKQFRLRGGVVLHDWPCETKVHLS